ncbi:hypothetical protein BIY22_08585 [Vibrio panuliri]|uniref:Ascorbate-specific PTS system EIIA component n=1 Tax=Vibrio panuliri TaxID=1381081 RepID=A0A1Q9HEQ3_9VIBR|nr:PTS sugar transporter subunit IIA [Vibrio panuliri]OLQ88213.1 hypothetical protein BIY22_08585 [Vibrio panuliri]
MNNESQVASLFGKRIKYSDVKLSWDDALEQSIAMLQHDGIVNQHYIEAIRSVTDEIGPYYILTDDLAMPHARPDEGVIAGQGGLSLLICHSPVRFDQEHSAVRAFIGLAAGDSEQHVLTISNLMNWLDSDDAMEKLLSVQNQSELERLVESA